MILEFHKTRPNVKTPVRANPSDAGLDVFWCPENTNTKFVTIKPQHGVVLETGCKFGVSHGWALIAQNRSSIAAKNGLIVGACVIDAGYNKEVFINLWNVSNKEVTLQAGDKIAQLVLTRIEPFRLVEADDELYDWSPIAFEGRTGGFGSTGNE